MFNGDLKDNMEYQDGLREILGARLYNLLKNETALEEISGNKIRGSVYTKEGARIMLWNKETVVGTISNRPEESEKCIVKPINFSISYVKGNK